jgi:NitT/TauT family transport system permease protein
MAVAGVVPTPRLRPGISPVTVLRIAAVIGLWILWEAVAASGLLYRGVIPSSFAILRAFFEMVITLDLWRNFAVTAYEVLGALLIGGVIGLACGLALGASKFLSRAYEPFAHYLAPTPKIVFLPVLMVAFGVGPARNSLSAPFPPFSPWSSPLPPACVAWTRCC